MIKKINLILVTFTFVVTSITNAQIIETKIQTIDSLVMSWNISNAPGGVIGIMDNGKLLFLKAFGLASLDYDIPNTDSTLFNIGSVSKQFTAIGIVRLNLENKLSLDDDIRMYLSELPDFGHKITIKHLLHHTSGLRDIHAVLTLAGWRDGDPRSNEDLFGIMKKQKELNFKPGDEYMYSNTNYIFMAKIIEVLSGEKFENWMKENVFLPLGLTETYIENNATRIVKGNATSYIKQKDNHFTRAVEYWNYTGSGNVHTTANDLLSWLNQYSNPSSGWEKSFELLQTTDTLNNGSYFNYAFGIEIDSINGTRRISHGGVVGGFRTYTCTFPNQAVSIVVMTNYSSSDSSDKLKSISEIILPQLIINSNQEEKSFKGYSQVPNDNLKKYAGDYWDGVVARKIYVRNDTLWYFRSTGSESPLQYIGNNEFIMMPKALVKVKFDFEKSKVKSMLLESGNVKDPFESFKPRDITTNYLSEFVGKYYSPELGSYYNFTIINDTLVGFHPRHGTFKTEATVKQDYFKSTGPIQTIDFIRNEHSKVIGMRVSFDRVKNLWLEKQK